MESLLIGLIIVVIVLPLFTYRLGLKDGLGAIKGKEPEAIIKNPIKQYKEHKENKVEKEYTEFVEQGFNNIMSYDGNKQKGSE